MDFVLIGIFSLMKAVDRLAELSLKHPIRISVDKKFEVSSGLQQVQDYLFHSPS
jgi:hypothetical protein